MVLYSKQIALPRFPETQRSIGVVPNDFFFTTTSWITTTNITTFYHYENTMHTVKTWWIVGCIISKGVATIVHLVYLHVRTLVNLFILLRVTIYLFLYQYPLNIKTRMTHQKKPLVINCFKLIYLVLLLLTILLVEAPLIFIYPKFQRKTSRQGIGKRRTHAAW